MISMRCSFTGREIPKGTGIMYVKANGTVMYFINSKAKNNALKLGRKGRDIKWTELSREYKAESGKQSRKTNASNSEEASAAPAETGKAKQKAKPTKKK